MQGSWHTQAQIHFQLQGYKDAGLVCSTHLRKPLW